MSQDSILFVFHTASKGNMDDLIQKAGLNTKEDVINQALIFYSYFIAGERENGPCLVKGDMALDEVEFDEFTDKRTRKHKRADTLDIEVNMDVLWNLTRRARLKDPEDTLTAALILYEQIIDAINAGLSVGTFDPDANDGDGAFVELTPKQRNKSPAKAAAKPPAETIPPKYEQH